MIGTRRGLTLWKNGKFRTYTQADGLGSDLVGALLRDRNGDLWIGTLHGLTRMKDGRFQTFTAKDGLASNVVTALHGDANGALWIGTEDGGLHRLQNGKIFHYAASLGLPASIYAILEDEKFLWLTSKTGIYRVGKADLAVVADGTAAALSVAQYGTADGMRVNECSEGGHPAAWRSQDGGLWFATQRGVANIDKRTALSEGLAPPVVIESLTVDDRAVDLRTVHDIAPGHDRLVFDYTGITFVSPQRVRFGFWLEGFDHNWVEACTRRRLTIRVCRPANIASGWKLGRTTVFGVRKKQKSLLAAAALLPNLLVLFDGGWLAGLGCIYVLSLAGARGGSAIQCCVS